MTDDAIKSLGTWNNNAEMIADVAKLYFPPNAKVLDPTYGLGKWWTVYRPRNLAFHDRYTIGGPDFRDMPHPSDAFDVVAFDPPYKLNGRPGSHASDERYGMHLERMSWQDRHTMIKDGITECVRVLKPEGILLVKCQDQVCGGRIRWQTREFADHAESCGTRLVDNFILESYRAQPEGRTQKTARHNYSTLLVFRKHKSKKGAAA